MEISRKAKHAMPLTSLLALLHLLLLAFVQDFYYLMILIIRAANFLFFCSTSSFSKTGLML